MELKEIVDKEDFRSDLTPQSANVNGMMISSKEDFERVKKLLKQLAGTYLFIDVWNCRAALMAMENKENGNGKTIEIDDWEDYLTEEDLVEAIEEHGGYINMSGHYPISDSVDRKIGARLVFLVAEKNKEMKIIPIDDGNSDFSIVELRDDGKIGKLTPHCKLHGAMNKVSKGGLWRCLRAEIVKTTKIKKGFYRSERVGDCRAGCKEIKA